MNFKDLGLSEKTIKAIEELGIRKPTTVQSDVIPSILEGKDIFTIAPERCGKTCSYVFPLIDIISRRQGQNILIITSDSAQSVIVSDRLAVFNKYHDFQEEILKDNSQTVNEEANVIIAAPDLLLDIASEGKIDLSGINILVVDDINLIKKKRQLPNLEKVLALLPAEKQNIVFTNRRSKETQDILDKILKAPAEIKIDKAKEDEASAPLATAGLIDEKAASIEPLNDTPVPNDNRQQPNAGENQSAAESGSNNRNHSRDRQQKRNNNRRRDRNGKNCNDKSQTTNSGQTFAANDLSGTADQNASGFDKETSQKGSNEANAAAASHSKTNAEGQNLPRADLVDREAVELMNRCKTFGNKTPAFLLIKGEIVRNEN